MPYIKDKNIEHGMSNHCCPVKIDTIGLFLFQPCFQGNYG